MLTNSQEVNLGYAEPYRNFIFIDDLLDAWVAVIENPDKCNNGNIFCLGPAAPIKIKHFAEKIANKLNWQGVINWNTKPARPGEIYLLNSTNKKITHMLGWEPKVDLDTGLSRTIEIWERNLGKK
jgi:nucleoside-diphosphate-sugar epimerase